MKDIIERLNNPDQLIACLNDAVDEIQSLRKKLDELANYYKSIMEEPCGDEVHCTCVPALRRKLVAAKKLAEAADNGEWHNSDDCKAEGRTDCELCATLEEWKNA